jgi:RNA polymerase sigma factor (sigma-70 family)
MAETPRFPGGGPLPALGAEPAPAPVHASGSTDAEGEAIANGLRARDPKVIDGFLEQYRALLNHCLGQFESAQSARDDLYQEIVAYILERLDKGSFNAQKGTFSTWLYRVAWCRCVDIKRRTSSSRRIPLVPSLSEISDPIDESTGPSQAADTSEVGELVNRCLTELDKEDAEILRMRHMRDMTLVEIADLRSQSLETIKYRLKRATQALRQRLATYRITEEVVE